MNDLITTFQIVSNHNYLTGTKTYRNYPVHVCFPAPLGRDQSKDALRIVDDAAKDVPCSLTPLCHWHDGSVRVWEAWFPIDLAAEQIRTFTLVPGRSRASFTQMPRPNVVAFNIETELADGRIVVQSFDFKAPTNDCDLDEVAPKNADEFRSAITRQTWSWHEAIDLSIRMIQATAEEELLVRRVSLTFDLPGKGDSRYTVKHAAMVAEPKGLIALKKAPHVIADPDGIHVTENMQIGVDDNDYPSYERGPYLGSVDPWIAMTDDENAWLLVVPEAHERYPKAWRIEGRRVTVDLHPAGDKPLRWRQGMALFQRVYLRRMDRKSKPVDFDAAGQERLRPPLLELDPETFREAGWRIPFVYQPERFPKTETYIRRQFEFSWERGTFNWGDQPAGGRKRNLEYDFPATAAKEYARTAGPWVYKLMRNAAEHMMYTDHVAVSNDKWKEGGICHHCIDHTNGSAYPSHMWAEGLTLYYQLTGDRYALTVAKRVGDFYLKYINERFQVLLGTGREYGWSMVALGAIYDLTREKRYLDGIKIATDYHLDRPAEQFYHFDASFTIAMGLIGMDRIRPFHREEDIRRFVPAVLDHTMATKRNEAGLYRYWKDSEIGVIHFLQTYMPEALNIGFLYTRDDKYLRSAWRQFEIHRGGITQTIQEIYGRPECGYAAGFPLTWMGVFQSFAQRGWLDKVQYKEPEDY